MRPEQPARVLRSAAHLQEAHPEWEWRKPAPAEGAAVRRAHSAGLLRRIQVPPDIDDDTPYFPGIHEHARRAAGSAIEAVQAARGGGQAFSLMRPPGHHATQDRAMGFCYLNQIAIAALEAQAAGVGKIAIWDFDAHHGNGTEDILKDKAGFQFTSVHQYPGYPGTGTRSLANCRNFPVAPHAPREVHVAALQRAWEGVLAFQPELILVSAGFDAYVDDPITEMALEEEDFATLGEWLRDCGVPAAAILEGGYSADLPQLIDAFLSACKKHDS